MFSKIRKGYKLKARREIVFSARLGILGFIIPTLISESVSPVVIGWGLTVALLGSMVQSKLSNRMMGNIENNKFIIALSLMGDVFYGVLLILMPGSKLISTLFFVFQGVSFLFYTPFDSLESKIEKTYMSGRRLGNISAKANNSRNFMNSLVHLIFLQINIALFYFLEHRLAVLSCVILNTILNVLDSYYTIVITKLYKSFGR